MNIFRACLGIVCLMTTFATAQVSDSVFGALDGDVPSDVIAPVEQAEPVEASLEVRLQNDGKLSGRLQMAYPTGKVEPADAKVSFKQDGDLLETVRTDESGHFHLTGLVPGDYVATATVGESSTDFHVSVLAFDPAADPDEMFLEGTLTPVPGGELEVEDAAAVDTTLDVGCEDCGQGDMALEGGCDTCGDEIIDDPMMDDGYMMDGGCCDAPMASTCDAGFTETSCGGCGGRGGLLGPALGAAGLATGIAGLAIDDDDDNNNVVSPSR